MIWLIDPINGFKSFTGVSLMNCDGRAFSGPCKIFASCSGSAELYVSPDPVIAPEPIIDDGTQ